MYSRGYNYTNHGSFTMRHFFFALLAVVVLTGCTKPEKTKQVLTQAGYTDIVITGYDFAACGKEDSFSTGFRAKGPNGHAVSGAVCSGLLKGNTIRLD